VKPFLIFVTDCGGQYFFQKKEAKLVTYESGGAKATVDYVLVQRGEIKNVRYVKVIPGDECLSQHKLLVMYWSVVKRKCRKWKEAKGNYNKYKNIETVFRLYFKILLIIIECSIILCLFCCFLLDGFCSRNHFNYILPNIFIMSYISTVMYNPKELIKFHTTDMNRCN